jgi:hypothetical protein
MAASDKWNGVADQGTVIHVVRGDRLASASTHICTADGGMKSMFVARVTYI